jgi:hypothetical protein
MPTAAKKKVVASSKPKVRSAKIIDFETLLRDRALKTKPPNKAFELYMNEGRGKKQKHPARSFEQLRQRELAWILYISEGFCANLLHALKVNCVTFDERDKALIGKVLANVETDTQKVRDWLKQIS